MTDNELLLAISEMLDKKLDANLNPIKNDVTNIKLTLENNILPRLQNIEACYTSTYDRYANRTEQIDAMQADIDIMKKVLSEHSEKLRRIS